MTTTTTITVQVDDDTVLVMTSDANGIGIELGEAALDSTDWDDIVAAVDVILAEHDLVRLDSGVRDESNPDWVTFTVQPAGLITAQEFLTEHHLDMDDDSLAAWLDALLDLRPVHARQDLTSAQAWLDSWARIRRDTSTLRSSEGQPVWTADVDDVIAAARAQLLDEDGLREAGEEWADARRLERVAADSATRQIRRAHLAGMTEVEIADIVGVNRTTVRRGLGK